MHPSPDRPKPGRLIVGGALLVIGVLILIPSGLCTTILGIGAVVELIGSPKGFLSDVSDIWPFALAIVAVAGFAILLIRAGLAIRGRE